MANEIKIVVTGEDKASDVLKRIQGNATGMGSALASTATVVTAAFAAIAAGGVLVGKSVVDAASSLEESRNKVNVVFKDMSGAIEQMARESADNMGLSKQAALEMAGTFGNLFTSMGLTRGASAEMSTGILQLGADLASFNNIPVEEALLKIRAGLVGEVEPLRAVGVNLNQVAIEQEAMRLGLLKTGETLSAANKAQAAYSLILQQTKNAQGDFARTSDGLANQQRILTANIDDLKAELGTALLPAINDVVSGMNEWIDQNGEQVAKNFATAVDISTAAVKNLHSALSTLVNSSPFRVAVQVAFDTVQGSPKAFEQSRNAGAEIRSGLDGIKTRFGGIASGVLGALGRVGAGGGELFPSVPNPAQAGFAGGMNGGLTDEIIANRNALAEQLKMEEVENDRIRAWQETLTGAVDAVADSGSDAANNMRKAGGGIKSAAEKMAEDLARLAERIAQQHTSEIVKAFLEGGDAAVATVRETHAQLDAQWVTLAEQMREKLGVEIPDEWRLMWEGMLEEQRESAKRLIEEEKKAADERVKQVKDGMERARAEFGSEYLKIVKQLWGQGGAGTSGAVFEQQRVLAEQVARDQALSRAAADFARTGDHAAHAAAVAGINITVNTGVGDPVAIGQQVVEMINQNALSGGSPILSSAVQS